MKNVIMKVTAPGVIEAEEREIRPLAQEEALVKVISSAICGSDLHIYRGKHPSVPLPVTIGHEFSGVIEALGQETEGYRIGDRVVLEPAITCGKCEACRRGQYNFCEHISFSYRNGDGAMARYVVCKTERLHHIPDEMTFDEGALMEPLSVAMHAVRRADIRLGDTVAIFGAGAIGIFVAAICSVMGAKQIIMSDLSDFRLSKAVEMGATSVINSSHTDPVAEIRQLTGGKGVDKAFECVGIESTFNQAMSVLKANGLLTDIGIFEKTKITIDASRFVTHEIRVQGAQGYCFDFPLAIDISRKIPVKKMITHIFPLNQLQEAMETAQDRTANAVKVVIHPQEE